MGGFTNEEPAQEVVVVEETVEEAIVVVPVAPEVEVVETRDQQLCLGLNIYHESRGDSFAGQAAVADVVLNRVESDLFPDTICEVVEQAVWIENWKGNLVPKRHQCHFSWFCDGVSDEPGDPDAWMESYMVAGEVIEGKWRGITEGATHYHAAHIRADWSNDRGMKYRGTIGQHEFYKWH